MLVRIVKSEDSDETVLQKQSDLGLCSLYRPAYEMLALNICKQRRLIKRLSIRSVLLKPLLHTHTKYGHP